MNSEASKHGQGELQTGVRTTFEDWMAVPAFRLSAHQAREAGTVGHIPAMVWIDDADCNEHLRMHVSMRTDEARAMAAALIACADAADAASKLGPQ
jgi:hypothetical protein